MFERYVLVYIFLCFSVGLACLGVTLILARRKDNHLARAFLAFYATLSVVVLSGLLLAFGDAFPDEVGRSTRLVLEYFESIFGFYGVIFTLPFFMHRVLGVVSQKRDGILLVVVLLAAFGQHITEYALDDAWDQRGDLIENGFFVAILVYTCLFVASHYRSERTEQPLAGRLLLIGAAGIPGALFDIFLAESTGLRIYPIVYCVSSVVVTWTLMRQPGSARRRPPDTDHGLSDREAEVLHLVQRGLSNKGIGEELYISPNTVKTHLRSIFEKTGARSRFELIARTTPPAGDPLQIENEPPS